MSDTVKAAKKEQNLYPQVQPNTSFPQIEEKVLANWKSNDTFQKSIDIRNEEKEFVFYDGPPFANGLPHYGHLVTGYVKDMIPRYQTMRGKKVDRRFGWDCHGLPAELQSEKELGISGRLEIEKFGIGKYNDHCRSSVLQFTKDWNYYVTRQARWVDFENDYKTMDTTFMESVMWAFKQLWDKGLIYEDYRVVPYSWAVESPLSNFETRLDNSYRMRQDPAVTITFTLKPFKGDEGKTTKIMAWTTTPWTLPSNLALAVGPEIDYVVMEEGNTRYILGAEAKAKYEKELANAEAVKIIKGKELLGLEYEPLFPYFADKASEGAFRVLNAAFVDTGDGTGVVHMAPGFGEEDLVVCRDNGIPVVVPVDSKGRFTMEVSDYVGELIFDANKPIIKRLKDEGKLVRHDTIDHNYPHCWRTDEPLIYKAINSWYLKVTAIKDRMVELNKNINWIPDHIKEGQFGRWLENARDWNIARNRFWGSPLPIWRSDDPAYPRMDCYGSIESLEKDFGVKVTDLHRPFIDTLTRPNPDDPTGKSTMRRVEDVLDCWFESGSMPFAQMHYPFENKERFESHFPGDFIVEYVAQTRGWFYTLMVLSTALFDKEPFKNCICHGVVLDEDHKKLSKRLKNYPDPIDVFNEYGSDALRWYLVASPLMVGGDLAIPKDGRAIAQTRNQILNPIWNAYTFFTMYANADQIQAELIKDSSNVLDQYILSKTRGLIETVQVKMDAYDIPGACESIYGFLDALTNWYIRRSRQRFWRSEKDADKIAAYNTLYTVLINLCKVAAPFLPLLTEEIYQGLTGEPSVHLTLWPVAKDLPKYDALVQEMDDVRTICSAALSIRDNENLRVRLPLSEIIVCSERASSMKPYASLIQEEINVKSVTLSNELEKYGRLELKINPQIGRRVGGDLKTIMADAKSGNWKDNGNNTITVAGHTLALADNDYSSQLVTDEGRSAVSVPNFGAVILDTKVTPDLEKEGHARDFIRAVQNIRKQKDLDITDRIQISVGNVSVLADALSTHLELIKSEVLANDVVFENPANEAELVKIGGDELKIGVNKA